MSNILELHPTLPQAGSVQIHYCGSPDCGRPHVVLFSREGQPMSQFICPDASDDGSGFAARLYAASIKATVERKERGR